VYVCLQPANIASLPPTPLANIFSDVNGLVPITQPIISDGFGHYNFYAAAGVYTVVVGLAGIVQQVYPDQSIGGASGTQGGGTALNLQVNGAPNSNQLLLNLVGQNSVSVVDAGNGTVNITGSVFQTNGVTNTLQTTLNLKNGPNITLTPDALGGVTINALSGGTSFGVSGQGWFLGAQNLAPISNDSGHGISTNGTVYAVQIILESTWVISKASAMVVTGNGSLQNFTAGIYNIAGTSLLINGGTFDTTGSQRYRVNPLSLAVTLAPGVYWFAWGSNGTSGGSVLCHDLEIWFQQMLNGIDFANPQTPPTRFATAANALSGGGLPATLGVLTPLDHTNTQYAPVVLFGV
jgi:hypothetical protein